MPTTASKGAKGKGAHAKESKKHHAAKNVEVADQSKKASGKKSKHEKPVEVESEEESADSSEEEEKPEAEEEESSEEEEAEEAKEESSAEESSEEEEKEEQAPAEKTPEEDTDPRARSVFVGNLSYNTSPEEIKEYFSQAGEVEECYQPQNQDGRPKGFAFVTFVDGASAVKAYELNETELGGRPLLVKPRLSTETNKRKRDDNSQSGGSDAGGEHLVKLFVRNIPNGTENDEFSSHFENLSGFEEAFVIPSRDERPSFGFVKFDNEDSMRAAFNANKNVVIGGSSLEIAVATPKRPRNNNMGGGRGNNGGGFRQGGGGGGGYNRRGNY